MNLDAELIPHGRRVRDLPICEFLNLAYVFAVKGMDSKQRRDFDDMLLPDEVVSAKFDEFLPDDLKGVRPPSWWHMESPGPTVDEG